MVQSPVALPGAPSLQSSAQITGSAPLVPAVAESSGPLLPVTNFPESILTQDVPTSSLQSSSQISHDNLILEPLQTGGEGGQDVAAVAGQVSGIDASQFSSRDGLLEPHALVSMLAQAQLAGSGL